MEDTPLKGLAALGQSIWLDCIKRDLSASGGLTLLIDEDGLRGIGSNQDRRQVLFKLLFRTAQHCKAERHY